MGVFLVMGRSDLRRRRRSAGLHGRDKHEGLCRRDRRSGRAGVCRVFGRPYRVQRCQRAV